MLINQEIRKIPFFRLVIPFIIGILLQLFFNFNETFLESSLFLSFLILIVYWFISDKNPNYHQRWIFGFITFFVLLFFAAFITSTKTKINKQIIDSELFIGIINEEPKETDKSIKLTVKTKSFLKDSVWNTDISTVLIYLKKDSLSKSLNYGDEILFENSLKEIQNSGNPDEFDYKTYLARKQIYFQSFLNNNQWKLLDKNKGNIVFEIAYYSRNKLLEIYKKNNISGDEFAILAALTLGVKDYLSDDIVESYSISGAMHILAVSGLHVGIIYIVLNNLLFFLRKKKSQIIIQSAIFIIVIWIFALITGLSPSVTRAATMLTFIIVGKASNRKPSTYNSLAISAFLILAVNPLSITYVGFQLSYLAVIAIVFFQPKIYNLLEINNTLLDKIWQLTSVSIAAQIGTAAISIYYFHQFPVYFLLTNIIAIPAAFIIILMAISLLIFNFIPFISSIIALILTYTIKLLNFLTSSIENLPYSSITDISINNIELILFYIAIAYIIVFFLNKEKKYFIISLTFVIFSLLFYNYRYFNQLSQNKFIVFNVSGKSAIGIINNQKLNLFADSSFASNDKNLKYLTGNLIANNFIKSVNLSFYNNKLNDSLLQNKCFIESKNLRIAVLDNSAFKNLIAEKRLKLDYIIISKGFGMNINELVNLFEFKQIILDSSLPNWQEKTILQDCAYEKINVYSTKEKGAFDVNF
ncbi:MAG: ComEC family competence protein [Bacteroidales bacterium]|nr:ComEC family competence protein [Bacteroidales bacterium]